MSNKKQEIIQAISEHKLIAILRNVPEEKLLPLANALYAGGVRLLEITYSADGHVTDEQTAEQIRLLATEFENRMFVGAGTVLTCKQVELTANAGGGYIISPNADAQVIQKTCELGMVSLPGCLTPSEIVTAHQNGADFVKLFPASALGPDYIKAIVAPLSHIRLLAVGGIHDGNMDVYRKAGVCGFGIGTNIIDKKLLAANDYAGIEELAKRYVRAAIGG